MIILDFGSGGTCRNDWPTAKCMIDALAEIDKERKCIIKWQLFEKAEPNIPLSHGIFETAYLYATMVLGFDVTASVFDKPSLDFLLGFDIPFVKIANRRDLDWLIGEVPRKIPVYVSVGQPNKWNNRDPNFDEFSNVIPLYCVSKYPASLQDYQATFDDTLLSLRVSDHTTDWTLYRQYQPKVYEVHYVLDDLRIDNPDGGSFARTPAQLREILA